MKKKESTTEQQNAVQELVIKTSNMDGTNVLNISLRVATDGQIKEMFGVDEKRNKMESEPDKIHSQEEVCQQEARGGS